MKKLGKLIKKRLIDLELTQTELAARIGVNHKYLSKIICGYRGPGRYTESLAKELGVSADELRRLSA